MDTVWFVCLLITNLLKKQDMLVMCWDSWLLLLWIIVSISVALCQVCGYLHLYNMFFSQQIVHKTICLWTVFVNYYIAESCFLLVHGLIEVRTHNDTVSLMFYLLNEKHVSNNPSGFLDLWCKQNMLSFYHSLL